MIKYSSYKTSEVIDKLGVGYYFSDLHICTIRGNKVLAFDGTNGLKLSLDEGRTYGVTKVIVGMGNIITRSKIYPNGNIMWADHTKCYYSTDNLATYNESTIMALGGGTFTPTTYDNFKQLIYDNEVIINDVLVDIWGNYSIEAGTEYDNINAWYTIDSGITIKSCFKAGVSLSSQASRHIHTLNYNSADSTFWMHTGDGIYNDCYWNKGTYDTATDIWTWQNMKSATQFTPYKSLGMIFNSPYALWGSDVAVIVPGLQGIYKALYTEMLDQSKIVKIFSTLNEICTVLDYGNGYYLATEIDTKNIHYSNDYGDTWTTYTITDGPLLNVSNGIIICNSGMATDSRWIKMEINEDGEVYRDFTKGKVLMLRIK